MPFSLTVYTILTTFNFMATPNCEGGRETSARLLCAQPQSLLLENEGRMNTEGQLAVSAIILMLKWRAVPTLQGLGRWCTRSVLGDQHLLGALYQTHPICSHVRSHYEPIVGCWNNFKKSGRRRNN